MQRLVVALAMFTAACGSSQRPAVDAPTTRTSDAPAAPSVAVAASPVTITRGEAVTLSVSVKNFTIISPLTKPPVKDGEGHYHYYVDDAAEYTAGWTPTFQVKTSATTPPGPHTVRVVLATNAHEEVTPVVEATATFTVQ